MIEGVIRTRVGYAGGKTVSPTYRRIGDHTETVQVDYDPTLISYDELLEIFWKSHGPTRQSSSRQYMKAIFYHDEKQRTVALASKTGMEKKIGGTVRTEVIPVQSFTMAEDYHQKYYLKHHKRLTSEMFRIYPEHQDFVYSTAVTRLNGYLGGYGTKDQLAEEIERLGLSAEGMDELAGSVRK